MEFWGGGWEAISYDSQTHSNISPADPVGTSQPSGQELFGWLDITQHDEEGKQPACLGSSLFRRAKSLLLALQTSCPPLLDFSVSPPSDQDQKKIIWVLWKGSGVEWKADNCGHTKLGGNWAHYIEKMKQDGQQPVFQALKDIEYFLAVWS